MNIAGNRVGIALAFLSAIVVLCALLIGVFVRTQTESPSISATYPSLNAAIAKARPSIVTIEVITGPRETYDRFIQRSGEEGINEDLEFPAPSEAVGSGIVLDRHGFIVTAAHLVKEVNEAMVRLADGRKFPAKKVGSDAASDLALLRIEGVNDLPEPTWAASDQLQPGDWVVTMGSPFGLEGSVGAGIVSRFDREAPLVDVPLIQSDAASNPGNSGGALVNQSGDIVGVCTGGTSLSGGSDGVSYAIPSNVALFVIERLRKSGNMNWRVLGIETQPITPDLAAKLNFGSAEGLVITDVKTDRPGDQAGLRTEDIITQIQGQPVRSRWDIRRLLADVSSGEAMQMEVVRRSKLLTLKVRPELSSLNDKVASQPDLPVDPATDLGLVITDASVETLDGLGLERIVRGVLIEKVNPNSVGHRNHLLAGMVIRQIGDRQVDSPEEYRQALAMESPGQGVLLLIETSHGSQFRVIK